MDDCLLGLVQERESTGRKMDQMQRDGAGRCREMDQMQGDGPDAGRRAIWAG